jgi:NAD(P)-dependent dehydrogenase (short-subunit alcohol dehydrogenase family)
MAVALITGASRGLGRALARDLAADGWALVLDARGAAPLAEVADELTMAGATVRAVVGDVADPAHRRALVDAARALGGLDLLVNNASVLGPSPQPALRDYALDVLADVYRVNVLAPLGLIQEARPILRPGAAVVNITSDASVEAYEGWGGYGSSKAALDQLGNVLAAEEPDLRVWTFDPGDMRTQMHQEAFPGEDISDRPEPETIAVPAFRRLLVERPPSARVRASELLEAVR